MENLGENFSDPGEALGSIPEEMSQAEEIRIILEYLFEAKKQLSGYGVTSYLVSDDNRPTTLKQRFRAQGKTLLRVSKLRQHDVSHEIANEMFDCIAALLPDADLLIFSDSTILTADPFAVFQPYKKRIKLVDTINDWYICINQYIFFPLN